MPNPVRHKAFWPWVGLLVILNLATRLPWLLKADKFINADHALWGLMARHIAQGLHFPYYMYGQGYMAPARPTTWRRSLRFWAPRPR